MRPEYYPIVRPAEANSGAQEATRFYFWKNGNFVLPDSWKIVRPEYYPIVRPV